jgi:Na+-translocating ferredoxin:NAD+ oxidoreductase subunit A
MSEYLLMLLGTALVNNVVLVKFLGLCPFMGVSKKMDGALGMGMATTFVLTLTTAATWLLEHWLLVPLGIQYLRILAFILVIAAVVQFTEMAIRKTSPALYQVLGIYLPLITTNCAVLGLCCCCSPACASASRWRRCRKPWPAHRSVSSPRACCRWLSWALPDWHKGAPS